jgi:hypothetical protein
VSEFKCTVCARDLRDDDLPACRGCLRRLDERLEDIPLRYAQLPDFLAPGSASDGSGRRFPLESKPPIRLDVIDQTYWGSVDSVLGKLESWVRIIREDRGWSPPKGQATVSGEVAFLRRQLDWLAEQTWLRDLYVEVGDILRRLRTLEGDRGPTGFGNCPVVLDNGVCGNRLFAPLYGDTIKCRACLTEWPRETWMHLGLVLEETA